MLSPPGRDPADHVLQQLPPDVHLGLQIQLFAVDPGVVPGIDLQTAAADRHRAAGHVNASASLEAEPPALHRHLFGPAAALPFMNEQRLDIATSLASN